jgi:hypothetical protein
MWCGWKARNVIDEPLDDVRPPAAWDGVSARHRGERDETDVQVFRNLLNGSDKSSMFHSLTTL